MKEIRIKILQTIFMVCASSCFMVCAWKASSQINTPLSNTTQEQMRWVGIACFCMGCASVLEVAKTFRGKKK